MPDDERLFARIYLAGDQFAGGRLPVDALDEIQRYQSVVLAAAKLRWHEEHPDESLPEGFEAQFKLVITGVENGSAQVLLERPLIEAESETELVTDDWTEYFEGGRDDFERDLRLLLTPGIEIEDSPLLELRDFQNFGASLQPGGSIQVTDGRAPTAEDPVLTEEAREEIVEPRIKKYKRARTALVTDTGALAGRLIELNADERRLQFRTGRGVVKGFYTDPELTASLRGVLNTSAKAPVVRLRGDVQQKRGRPFRIRNINQVELLEIDGQPWSRKLAEIATLGPDWGGDAPGAHEISYAAIDAARDIVRTLVESGLRRPGIFPTEEGGVLLEWSSARTVTSIEISPDVSFDLYHLPNDTNEGGHERSSVITRAIEFAGEVLHDA